MATPQHTECGVCTNSYEDLPANIVIIEGSSVCHGCVIELFQRAVDNESNYPLTWGQTTLHINDFHHILPADLCRHFADKEREYEIPPADRLYCKALARHERFGFDPLRDTRSPCGTFVGRKVADSEANTNCPKCGNPSCVGCGEPIVGPVHACKRAEIAQRDAAAFDGLVRGKDFQICPNKRCGRRLQLTDGCNHLHCLCRQQLCFVCGEPATGGSDHWTRGNTNACPRYNQPMAPNAMWDDLAGHPGDQNLLQRNIEFMEDAQARFVLFQDGMRGDEGRMVMINDLGPARRNAIAGLPGQDVDAVAGAEDEERRARRRAHGARARAVEEHNRRQALQRLQQSADPALNSTAAFPALQPPQNDIASPIARPPGPVPRPPHRMTHDASTHQPRAFPDVANRYPTQSIPLAHPMHDELPPPPSQPLMDGLHPVQPPSMLEILQQQPRRLHTQRLAGSRNDPNNRNDVEAMMRQMRGRTEQLLQDNGQLRDAVEDPQPRQRGPTPADFPRGPIDLTAGLPRINFGVRREAPAPTTHPLFNVPSLPQPGRDSHLQSPASRVEPRRHRRGRRMSDNLMGSQQVSLHTATEFTQSGSGLHDRTRNREATSQRPRLEPALSIGESQQAGNQANGRVRSTNPAYTAFDNPLPQRNEQNRPSLMVDPGISQGMSFGSGPRTTSSDTLPDGQSPTMVLFPPYTGDRVHGVNRSASASRRRA